MLRLLQRYNIYTMGFEYDSEKSDANQEKHGIDFSAAQALWNDPDRIEIPALTADEPRFLVIGKIDGKHWSGIITYRGENIRIISVRRSRREEVDIYEG
ncbi:MAG: BrnT family toxin [Oryzomonas sp.]|nr:BrnT family toxin [Oryzomonas sp.]MDR3578796.1 BrnT family toxin [Oryzomonas sp.]